MRFLEILLGILLFPIMIIIGLIKAYQDYHIAFMSASKDDIIWNTGLNYAAQNAVQII